MTTLSSSSNKVPKKYIGQKAYNDQKIVSKGLKSSPRKIEKVSQVVHNIKALPPCSLTLENIYCQVCSILYSRLPECIKMTDQGPANLLFPQTD